MSNKVEQVKTFFNQTELYLKIDFNIRIRTEVVQGFVGNQTFASILDIGCGNGAISLPLLRRCNHLTLLDVSSNMLSIARSNIPPELEENVKTINGDFMQATWQPRSFDLMLCLGVLAHVDSPEDVIAKMVYLLKPGGSIIVQNSDMQHPFSHLLNFYSKIRRAPVWAPYTLNRLSSAALEEKFRHHRLDQIATYRYNLSVPGMARILNNARAYTFIKKVYGPYTNNYGSRLGSECIYHLRKPDSRHG